MEEKRKLFQYLVLGTKSAGELLQIADRLNLDLSAPWYNIILIKIQSGQHTREEYSNSRLNWSRSFIRFLMKNTASV